VGGGRGVDKIPGNVSSYEAALPMMATVLTAFSFLLF